ncbi:glycosyltransferase family 4 protein [Candidatus Blastococcus massiliensis]|uniref:glycosyltransferase family 4 protein n=1 Tax=Candidatus Blastococcus massiliensis TaxID=1470358 RepID=UPI0004B4BB21|nr:glycosyltransferase family 1 protein [Candidatus Blastococcus massiliensis]
MNRLTARLTRPVGLAARMAGAPPSERQRLHERASLVVATLSGAPAPAGRRDLLTRLEQLLESGDPAAVWLTLSVLEGRLATPADVRRTVRAIRLDGVGAALGATVARIALSWLPQRDEATVRVVQGAVLVDLDHTARTGLATGIQRVARETVRRWSRDHDVVLVGWDADYEQLRLLTPAQATTALTGEGAVESERTGDVVVPWESTYLLPELSLESERNERISAVAQYARGRTGVIGFDCVPITTAETTALGVSEAFARNLSAVRHMDRVSAISRAAAAEYGGWRTMLGSVGDTGPEIVAAPLPAEARATSEAELDAAREQLTVPGMPMVLCVGTHEPRKNHLALLHAAELLWREGVEFNLVLIGGRSWNDERFQRALGEARALNRPVDTPQGVTDAQLWAAYRLARCMVFPSLNEGYGLPVAEALACGTPVITSGYGSMAEIAADGGALLVDARDDHDIAAALRTLLTDDAERDRLAAEARNRPVRTWDDYARDVWDVLTG